MWKAIYQNTRLLILTFVLILVWGVTSFFTLPRMEDPEIEQPRAMVTTLFPGASASRVESLITDRLESALQELDELETIESISRPGTSVILLERKEDVPNIDEAWARVREKLTEVTPQLPENASPPDYISWEGRAYAMALALVWQQPNTAPNYAIMKRQAEELEDRLKKVPGTEQIHFFGSPLEEVTVEVNSSDLAALGLTSAQLAMQIQESDAKVPAGRLRNQNSDLSLEVESELNSLDQIRQIPIRNTNGSQFAILGDVATVSKGIQTPPSSQAIIQEKPAVVLGLHMESGKRIDSWAASIRREIEIFDSQLPEGIELRTVMDQSQYVEKRINGLVSNLMLGVVCVVVSTIPIMGWRSGIVLGSTLPLSILLVFGGMGLLNIPLHQMSVTGLVIALGLLIDNAIVVVDAIQEELSAGLSAEDAIKKKVSYLAIPLLASTATTVLTFVPIAFAPGRLGDFVGSIGISVILALASSLFLSLTIIPTLTSRIHNYRRRPSAQTNSCDHESHWLEHGFSHPQLLHRYRRILQYVIARPRFGICISLLLPVLGFVAAITLEQQFFPPAARDQINIEFELQNQAAIALTEHTIGDATQVIKSHSEVEDVSWFLGENAPTFYYNLQRGRQNASNYAQAIVQLDHTENLTSLIKKLQSELDLAFPSAQVLVMQLEQGPPFAAPIEMRLFGPDLEVLRNYGEQVRQELIKVSNITHTRASLVDVIPQLAINLEEEAARLAGLSNSDIARQLNTSLEGAVGGSILEETEEIPVRVRLSDRNRTNLNEIASLDLLTGTSVNSSVNANPSTLPLVAIGNISLRPERATIPHRDGQRVNTIQAFLQSGVLPSTALSELKKRLKASDFTLPPGYSYEFGGEAEQQSNSSSSLQSSLGVLLVMMATVLVLSFNSFRLASIVSLVGACAMGLGLLALWVFGYPLGFMAILGTVGLVGIAVNDSIVVLAALRENPLARQGHPVAMVEVIIKSTRHVLATTVTTIAGFIPLLLDGGSFWPPLAICVAGGVGGATLLALCFVPCLYLMMIRKSVKNNSLNALNPPLATTPLS